MVLKQLESERQAKANECPLRRSVISIIIQPHLNPQTSILLTAICIQHVKADIPCRELHGGHDGLLAIHIDCIEQSHRLRFPWSNSRSLPDCVNLLNSKDSIQSDRLLWNAGCYRTLAVHMNKLYIQIRQDGLPQKERNDLGQCKTAMPSLSGTSTALIQS